jgi:adhesin/invasin
MYTEPQTFHRISYFIFLIGLFSVGLTGQRVWSSWLPSLTQTATTMTSALPVPVVAAGPPALLLLNTDALVAPINGGVATLTARVRDAEGKPVAGVAVNFASEHGTLSPATASTDAQGMASTTFTAGGTPGQAIVTATAGNFTQTAAIQIVKPNSDAPKALAVEIGSRQIPTGQQTAVTIRLRDAAGQPVAGELVTFFGALGTVTPASAVTDAQGRATANFQAGTIAGQALITALAGSASQSISIQVGDQVMPPPPPGSGDTHSIYLPVVTR